MKNGLKVAFLTVATTAAASSLLFLKQGGFGGGHGEFDKAIFVLGLPWAAISWPPVFMKHDFVWLIGLPLVLNLTSVFVVAAVITAGRRNHRRERL
jgi:hypothetical protein